VVGQDAVGKTVSLASTHNEPIIHGVFGVANRKTVNTRLTKAPRNLAFVIPSFAKAVARD
jgi:hypothetical protein